MSDSLIQLFNQALKLDNDTVAKQTSTEKYSAIQQAQIRQWLTLSQRFPQSLPELNDTLRETTYLLGTQAITEIDSIVFGRVKDSVAKFSKDETVQNRHIVRWSDLIQHDLKLDPSQQIKVDKDAEAPREIKQKPKKADGKDPKDAKPEAKQAQAKDAAAAAKEPKEEGAKKEKKEKKKKEQPKPAAARPVTPGVIDFKVGFIEKAVKHPDADSLYVSTINVGEDEPRTICSGLVKYVSLEDMQKRYVVVVANLKPVKMRGILSCGMVLCASDKEGGVVEFVNPPEGSQPGDKLFFESYDEEPEAQLNPKKKLWEQIQPDFTTTEGHEIVYRKEGEPERKLVNKSGTVLKCSTLKGASVS